MKSFKNLIHDLREIKAAALSHNLSNYEPEEPTPKPKPDAGKLNDDKKHGKQSSVSSVSSSKTKPVDTATAAPSTSKVPAVTTPVTTSLVPTPGSEVVSVGKQTPTPAPKPATLAEKKQYIPPPPPPRGLPHGWTARFDEKEGKFAYSKGLAGKEQWTFPSPEAKTAGE